MFKKIFLFTFFIIHGSSIILSPFFSRKIIKFEGTNVFNSYSNMIRHSGRWSFYTVQNTPYKFVLVVDENTVPVLEFRPGHFFFNTLVADYRETLFNINLLYRNEGKLHDWICEKSSYARQYYLVFKLNEQGLLYKLRSIMDRHRKKSEGHLNTNLYKLMLDKKQAEKFKC